MLDQSQGSRVRLFRRGAVLFQYRPGLPLRSSLLGGVITNLLQAETLLQGFQCAGSSIALSDEVGVFGVRDIDHDSLPLTVAAAESYPAAGLGYTGVQWPIDTQPETPSSHTTAVRMAYRPFALFSLRGLQTRQ
ncbi:hypothetical protein A9C11_32890 (plasmid) [Pseudomonas citronellolis]|uniref:Uncharacterized protein n=1 Tax=Pseudomonas citronellolis TaxID=53408 RepID=A0A1A9KMU9_9PSED|nr:hypothetical protein A9C11_32890 [Pseudomonas citronellolis]